MNWQRIGVVTAIPPAGAANAPGSGLAVNALRVELGNVIEITGASSGVAGTAILLRWFPPPPTPAPPGFSSTLNTAGEWRPWREDAPMQVAAGPSFFSGRYDIPKNESESWLLMALGGDAGTPTITADAQGSFYRGAS
jgi:hypothetical protein